MNAEYISGWKAKKIIEEAEHDVIQLTEKKKVTTSWRERNLIQARILNRNTIIKVLKVKTC